MERGQRIAMQLERADGSSLDLASLRGRALVVIAFTMDDLASHATLRNAERVAERCPEDIAVVAVSGGHFVPYQHRILLQSFANVLGLRRTQLALADDVVRRGESPLGVINAVPTIFLINRAGVIARRVEGYQSPAQLGVLIAPAVPPRCAEALRASGT